MKDVLYVQVHTLSFQVHEAYVKYGNIDFCMYEFYVVPSASLLAGKLVGASIGVRFTCGYTYNINYTLQSMV